ncbi:DUF484 family protein [Coralloluteibacterium stylophorae]|uniref:DUF484 family protein n=1 Tax=Coralloluteibacterium stylophorae TaxID=1776034 RepID=A0A8J7VRW0_9GAMM|nr:DUF484 family protein [Coralloluteibacterium stylophorae]MBS7458810.1 DUF484 family protein [Coralloluteibacterium stylophorae]
MSNDTHADTGASEVAAWLRRHPDFLAHYPDLAQSLVMPRAEGQATSLASYQLEVLREKNRELNRRLLELFANAQENERLAVRTHQLTLALMRQPDAAATLRAMVASLGEDFAGDAVRVVLFEAVAGLETSDWLRVVARDSNQLQPFADFLAAREPLCGRLNADKLDMLFAGDEDAVQSVALLPLAGLGMLAIGSRDANRFYPGVGTLFLGMMADALVAGLRRFRR